MSPERHLGRVIVRAKRLRTRGMPRAPIVPLCPTACPTAC